jgi:WhiB family redox-sensing transcriptional regulator
MSKKKEPVILNASDALCAEIDPELWFPSMENGRVQSSYAAANYAKSVCARCPLTIQCLLTAIHNKEEYGIWGGSTPNERKNIRTANQAKKFIVTLQAKADDLGMLKPKRNR